MPSRPKRICKQGGCSAAIATGVYCEKHKREPKVWPKRTGRPSPASLGYNAEWRKIRARVLAEDPYCFSCRRPANEVHHDIPLAQGGTNDRRNLKSVCKACHARITARERWAAEREAKACAK